MRQFHPTGCYKLYSTDVTQQQTFPKQTLKCPDHPMTVHSHSFTHYTRFLLLAIYEIEQVQRKVIPCRDGEQSSKSSGRSLNDPKGTVFFPILALWSLSINSPKQHWFDKINSNTWYWKPSCKSYTLQKLCFDRTGSAGKVSSVSG